MARTITKQCPRVLLPNNTYRIHAREFTLAEPVEGTLVMPTYLSITRVLFIKTWYRVRRRVSHARSLTTTCIPGVAFPTSTQKSPEIGSILPMEWIQRDNITRACFIQSGFKLTEKRKGRVMTGYWKNDKEMDERGIIRDDFRDSFFLFSDFCITVFRLLFSWEGREGSLVKLYVEQYLYISLGKWSI